MAVTGEKVKSNIAAFIDSAVTEENKHVRREAVLLSGVYALLVFVQANWTGRHSALRGSCSGRSWWQQFTRFVSLAGPDLHEDIRKFVPDQRYKDQALDSLMVDGETMHSLTRYMNFMQHARWILYDSFELISSVKVWNTLSCAGSFVHLKLVLP